MKTTDYTAKTILLVSFLCLAFSVYRYAEGKELANTDPALSLSNEVAQKERIPYKLIGTLIESDPAKSVAVLQDIHTAKQGVYKIADELAGYQIVKIIRGGVVFLKHGKMFSLELPSGSLGPISLVSANTRVVNRSILSKRVPDFNTAFGQAIPVPQIESGKIVGFKITGVKDKALAEMAGLKEGDIATRVNGEKIESMQKALELYQKTKDQDKIDLEIKRGGQIHTLTYYLN